VVFFDLFFFRHPLARLQSLYRHFRSIQSDDPLCVRAHAQGPAEFMRGLLSDSPHLVSNVQVTYLAHTGAFTRPANESDLDRATHILEEMAVPGVVEMYRESMVAAEYHLRPAFPGLHLHYTPQNVTRPLDHHNGSSEDWEALWGSQTYQQLVKANQLDLELFRRAKAEIRGRMEKVPNWEQRIAENNRASASLVELARQVNQPVLQTTR